MNSQNTKIFNKYFENEAEFKYLGMTVKITIMFTKKFKQVELKKMVASI
jgi:hypothetical protein